MSFPRLHKRLFSEDGAGETIKHDALPIEDKLPSQSGQSGKFLTTDGTATSWATVEGGVKSVSLEGGTNNGTLKLTVDSVPTDNIAVTGLGSLAYKSSLEASDIPSITKSKISDFPTNVSAFTNDSGYLTSHQDISGKANVSGSRGTLAGYCTSGSATTINASSADCNETSSNVTISAGSSGTSWTKIVRLTAAVTVTLGSGWSWVGGSAPTIKANGVLICCWCGSGGVVNYANIS